jgi:F0F1-type ATP synthase assembly protein I
VPSDEEHHSEKDNNLGWRQALASAGLALSIPWTIVIPAYIGWRIDRWLDTWPLWFTVSLIVGLLGAAFDLYALRKRFRRFG